jgi:hypothetical protein
MWKPRRLTTLWAFTACYRDSFTFLDELYDYAFYMANGESSYYCGACVERLRSVRAEDNLVRFIRFTSTSETDKKDMSAN